ncbi:polysaccharide deacetylase family protein [Acetobacter persici]|uniref:polysaccharide deacetylase family protein n=1 Tax=Acetobacter persici TaxID=1076596 RepID=UPI0020CEB876|nr:polysaccharide deacetylase family protein [Acetobacter persici]MCP9318783.1 polysaccharide deacetylase family protein [Acetobacter persici]
MRRIIYIFSLLSLSIITPIYVNGVSFANDIPEKAKPQVAITLDDLPFVSSVHDKPSTNQRDALDTEKHILLTLRTEHIPATGFVNEDKVEALGQTGTHLLAEWNENALELGNHGYHHFDSNNLSVPDIEQEIVRGENHIRPLAENIGRRLKFFRFPYNHTGNTDERRIALSDVLKKHGYALAATTIDAEDYLFAQAYDCAYSHHHKEDMRKIRSAFLDYVRIEVPYYQRLNQTVMGRDVPAVMLLHASRLNAVALQGVLQIFRQNNYRFVSLSQAQSDPAYSLEPAVTTQYGPAWGYRWAREKQIKVNGALEQEAPDWIKKYCASHKANND